MKITLPNGTKIEMDDPETPEPMPEEEVKSASETKPTPEAAAKQPEAKSKDAKPSKPTPTPKETAKPSAPQPQAQAAKPEENYSPRSSGDFENMGGICNISDPQVGNPKVFQFQMPREE